ncbi:MAG: Ppx/GppA family phosphatase [Deltaproteobacteria bacterium]|nr:Ppx/GppA family phosphatase [Deltaproteobacteria bacterium]
MRVAAIDVGSNSIHMVVAQVESDGRFHVLDRAKEMVRLGRTLGSGRLSSEAMNAGMRTLAAFKTLAERQGVQRFNAVATSAVREAKNGGDFVQRVKDEIWLRIKVIPGREEARLTYLGVRHAIDLRSEPTLIVDAGGGSVELVLVDDDKAVAFESVKLGVARLCDQFLGEDRPSAKQLGDLEAHLSETLDTFLDLVAQRKVRRVVGTSGTILNLIAIAGHERGEAPNGHLNNFTVTADEVARVRRMVTRSDREERVRIKGLDAKRVDFIVAAACVVDYTLRYIKADVLVACTWALREGVLLDYIARHARGIEEAGRYEDPRRRSVARFARHLGHVGAHGPHVARLALQLYDQLEEELSLPTEARDWLEFAALLHDIGHHIGHKDHQRHAYYLISNGELLGFRRDEIEVIALVARYHRKAAPKDGDENYAALPKADRRTVRALSGILRVADGLDRSHYGVVRDVAVLHRDDRITLNLHTARDDSELEVWEARRRSGLLAEVLGVDLDFEVVAEKKTAQTERATASR